MMEEILFLDLQFFAEEEKTEDPTPKKKRDARKKGQVAKSTELSSAVNLLAMVLMFFLAGSTIFRWLHETVHIFLHDYVNVFSPTNIANYSFEAFIIYFKIMAPMFLTAVSFGLIINYAQVGFLFTTESMKPQFNRINPIEGFKRIFSLKSLFELTKSLLKIIAVGSISYIFIRGNLMTLLEVLYTEPEEVFMVFSTMAYNLALYVGIFYIMLSVLDYVYQKYEFTKSIKMTKHDIKQEYKQMEGDPLIRSKLKEKQRAISQQRMMQEVPDSTVVVTNPTELAIALKYDEKQMAPMVVAKGAALVAKRIREIAKEHDIPILENKPVARMLYERVEIGEEVPVDMYQAIAEILAFVYRMKKKKV